MFDQARRTRTACAAGISIVMAFAVAFAGCGDEDGADDGSGGLEPDSPAETLDGVDVHQHLSTAADFEQAAANLIELMDEVGIERSLLLPPPMSGDLDFAIDYDYRDLASITDARNDDRLGFIGGGKILNSRIHALVLEGREPTADELAAFETDARAIAAAGAAAFGEMAILHLSYQISHPFIEIPGDHPLLLRLADIAAELDLPIDIHLELVTDTTPTPPFFRTVPEGNNPEELEPNLEPFERLLAHNRDADIVWVHVGWDNIGATTVDRLRSMLAAHSNLHVGLKMLDNPGPVQVLENRPLDESGAIRAEWLTLITDLPDRFLLGADEFVGDGTQPTVGAPSTRGTWALVDALPDEVARQVAVENARRVYRLAD